MPDEQDVIQPEDQQPAPPDGAQNTDPPATDEKTVPYSRFQEVNAEKKRLEAAMAKKQADDKAAEDQRLAEQQQWQELADKRAAELKEAQDKITEMEKAHRLNAITGSIKEAAGAAGFANPQDAAAFIDPADVQTDDDGRPVGVTDLVKKLAEERPYLLAQTKPAPGNGSGPAPAGATDKIAQAAEQAARRFRL